MRRITGREIYSGTVLLIIGTIYLAAQADSFFSVGSVYVEGDVIKLSKNEFLSHLRTVTTVLLSFSGGILLLKSKRSGWIISQSLLLLLVTIATGILISNYAGLKSSAFVVIAGILILLLAIIFLLQKRTREKYSIRTKHFVLTFILSLALIAFYFFLQ